MDWLDHQQCHHTNALLDLPRLPGKSVQKSQKTLYLFLLLVGPGDWDFAVQIFNILFLQTSHFCVSSIGTRFPALPPWPSSNRSITLRTMGGARPFPEGAESDYSEAQGAAGYG